MPFIPYSESLGRLKAQVAAGQPIIGAGAGTGISAKFAELSVGDDHDFPAGAHPDFPAPFACPLFLAASRGAREQQHGGGGAHICLEFVHRSYPPLLDRINRKSSPCPFVTGAPCCEGTTFKV
jgi:hypothetical protein